MIAFLFAQELVETVRADRFDGWQTDKQAAEFLNVRKYATSKVGRGGGGRTAAVLLEKASSKNMFRIAAGELGTELGKVRDAWDFSALDERGRPCLQKDGKEALCMLLIENESLLHLDLSNQKMQDAKQDAKGGTQKMLGHLHDLATGIAQNRKLQTLKLANNGIDQEGMRVLATPLAEHKELRTLDLSSNKIGQGAGKDLAAVVRKCPKLQCLFIQSNQLAGADVARIIEALKLNTSVTELDTRHNGRCNLAEGKRVAEVFKEKLAKGSKLPTFAGLVVDELVQQPMIDLSGCVLGSAEAYVLGSALEGSKVIREVDLRCNSLQLEDAKFLINSLQARAPPAAAADEDGAEGTPPPPLLRLGFNALSVEDAEALERLVDPSRLRLDVNKLDEFRTLFIGEHGWPTSGGGGGGSPMNALFGSTLQCKSGTKTKDVATAFEGVEAVAIYFGGHWCPPPPKPVPLSRPRLRNPTPTLA